MLQWDSGLQLTGPPCHCQLRAGSELGPRDGEMIETRALPFRTYLALNLGIMLDPQCSLFSGLGKKFTWTKVAWLPEVPQLL